MSNPNRPENKGGQKPRRSQEPAGTFLPSEGDNLESSNPDQKKQKRGKKQTCEQLSGPEKSSTGGLKQKHAGQATSHNLVAARQKTRAKPGGGPRGERWRKGRTTSLVKPLGEKKSKNKRKQHKFDDDRGGFGKTRQVLPERPQALTGESKMRKGYLLRFGALHQPRCEESKRWHARRVQERKKKQHGGRRGKIYEPPAVEKRRGGVRGDQNEDEERPGRMAQGKKGKEAIFSAASNWAAHVGETFRSQQIKISKNRGKITV